jgi:hypothetical protein
MAMKLFEKRNIARRDLRCPGNKGRKNDMKAEWK